jgi:hypothetical protein
VTKRNAKRDRPAVRRSLFGGVVELRGRLLLPSRDDLGREARTLDALGVGCGPVDERDAVVVPLLLRET